MLAKFNFKKITAILIAIYVLGSLVAFAYLGINRVYQSGIEVGAASAYVQFVNQVITEAQECKPFPIYNKDANKSVEVINVECLQPKKESK